MNIFSDDPQNRKRDYMRWADYIISEGIGWLGIFLYSFVIYCYHFYPNNILLTALFIMAGLFWMLFIYISIRVGCDIISKNKLKKEEKKQSLIKQYESTWKIFNSLRSEYQEKQVWQNKLGCKGIEPKEITEISNGLDKIERMLYNL